MKNNNFIKIGFLISFLFVVINITSISVRAISIQEGNPEEYIGNVCFGLSKKTRQEIYFSLKKNLVYERIETKKEIDLGNGYYYDNNNIYQKHAYRSWEYCPDCDSSGWMIDDYGVHECLEDAGMYIQVELCDYTGKVIGIKNKEITYGTDSEKLDMSFKVKNNKPKVFFCRIRVLLGNETLIIPLTRWSEKVFGTNLDAFKKKPIQIQMKSPSKFVIKSMKMQNIKGFQVKISNSRYYSRKSSPYMLMIS